MLSLSIRSIKLPEWLRENNRLRTAALICIGLLCADLLMYSVFVVPPASRLRKSEMRYAELKKERAEAVLFEKQKQELTSILAGIPTQKDMPLLVKELVQSARRLNLAVAPIQYEPKQSGEDLAMISFSFPVEGRYADIKRFLYDLETSPRLIGIQDLKLANAEGRIGMSMKLMTYIKGKRAE